MAKKDNKCRIACLSRDRALIEELTKHLIHDEDELYDVLDIIRADLVVDKKMVNVNIWTEGEGNNCKTWFMIDGKLCRNYCIEYDEDDPNLITEVWLVSINNEARVEYINLD